MTIPFLQYEREGDAALDARGRIRLDNARVTNLSLSDVTRCSIQGTANYECSRNMHNRDAGLSEIVDGFKHCAKGAVVDEFKSAFTKSLEIRGYPTSKINFAYNVIGKPLWRIY